MNKNADGSDYTGEYDGSDAYKHSRLALLGNLTELRAHLQGTVEKSAGATSAEVRTLKDYVDTKFDAVEKAISDCCCKTSALIKEQAQKVIDAVNGIDKGRGERALEDEKRKNMMLELQLASRAVGATPPIDNRSKS